MKSQKGQKQNMWLGETGLLEKILLLIVAMLSGSRADMSAVSQHSD